ncbi:hypothetical protein OG875_14910 [Streptomyces sp. NBC_01498]|uniref:hypothetical protein n=1 Tax=Streptomyces sp. NBC_01498 TaxID=2975870 RepID=UPI002E7AB779|nr:hypothetical protein [Streptomyces sp. NBC_01498]WTL25775.1 hypothetical protein OG875_14910 [Streptomyces sp. NBC_01498]
MKIRLGASALLISLTLSTLTGCAMTDGNGKSNGTDSTGNAGSTKGSGDIPSAGTSNSEDAADRAEQVSSELFDLIGIKGKATEPGPGVSECDGKDPETYFRIFHPWSLFPASADQLDGVMERLKTELPQHGWEVVEYGPDTSKNQNLSLTADNDEKKHSVNITYMAKDERPRLSLMLVSGCYQVPDGEKVYRF